MPNLLAGPAPRSGRWLCFSFVLCSSPTALAQGPATPVTVLAPVVVTATRFPDPAANAPISVRVIDAADLASAGASSLPEALVKLGGVYARNNSGAPDDQIDLRGFGATSDSNTLVLVDGVRINEVDGSPTRLSTIPLDAIDRIEILPGGGAVQYGGGATGGTVNIITKEPRARRAEGSLAGALGSFRTSDVRADATVSGDVLGLALFASGYDTENYRRNNAVRQHNLVADVRSLGGGPKLGLKFGVDRQEARFPGPLGESRFRVDPRAASTPNDWGERDGGFATLSGSARAGALDVLADLGWRGSATQAFFDGFGALSYSEAKLGGLTFSPRVRWTGSVGSLPGSVVLGVDWADWRWDRRTAAQSSDIGAPAVHQDATQTSQAAYLQAGLRPLAATHIRLGGRIERVEDALRTDVTAAEQRRTRSLSAVEIAVRQRLAMQWDVLARASTSYRLPHVFENNGDRLLEPQKARGFELGVEGNAARWAMRLNVYLIRLKNEIYFSPLAPNPQFGFPGANVNLSPTERRGVEWSVTWRASTAVEFGAGLIVQRAIFSEGTYGGVDVTGKEVPLVPRYIATLRGAWTPIEGTRLALVYRHVGPQRFDGDQDNTFARRMPTYGLLDVALSHQRGPWTFSASVRNALDERYFNYGFVFAGATEAFVYPQAGRTFLASLAYRFR